MVIGLSGVAGAGKDLFASKLIEELESQGKTAIRVALADALKKETRSWCENHYKIDPISCPREDKEKIREFLVFHGTFKRRASKGRHWVNTINDHVIKMNSVYDYVIVTDIRYNFYEKDEAFWIQKELQGKLIHISQYQMCSDVEEGALIRTVREPVNSEERANDPRVKKDADFLVEWEFIDENHPQFINKDKYLNNKVVSFIEWLNAQ